MGIDYWWKVPMHLAILPPWWHLVFEWLAYFVGFRMLKGLRKKDSLDSTSRNWSMGACIVGAAIGSKVVVWLDNPAWFFQEIHNPIVLLTTGKGIGGALVGGLIGVEFFKYFLGIKRATGDLFVFPLITAIIIGRVGCFLTGYYDHTYGIPTELPWGVDFGDGVLRHPTQLYEILFLSLLLTTLIKRSRTPFTEGYLFRYFMIGYFAFRFVIEFIKPVPHELWGLNGTQLLSLGVLVYYFSTISELLIPLITRKQPL